MDISNDQALKQLKDLLGLEKPPKRIEGYDISHQSGENVVGSMVVFTNGASDRAEYRKFKLHHQKNDDTKNLREIIGRRLKHENWTYPDLVILDGGEGQINAVKDLLDAAKIPVIGRNKSGDHSRNTAVNIVIPEKGILEINPHSHLAKLVARIDEEAHRFAITYHRLLKRKNMLK